MSWQPKLVALDVDGTLVDHAGQMPQRTWDAVRRIVDVGVPVVISTGRGWHATRGIVEQLELPPGQHACSNGAVRVSYPPLELREVVTFDPADVITRAQALLPHAAMAAEVVGEGYRITKPFPDGELSGTLQQVSVDELKSQPVTRIVIRDPEATDVEFVRLAEQLGLQGVSYVIGYTAWLDITPEGLSKATGLAEIAAEKGICADDVLAIGDGRNDVEMLQWAGRGVAVGDAPVDVQAVADHVTGTFAQAGTAVELERWFAPTPCG